MASYTGFSSHSPTRYTGPNVSLVSIVTVNRSPTGADLRQPSTGKLYPIGSYWLVSKNPTTGTEGDLWYLSKIVANVSYWLQVATGIASAASVLVDAFTAPGTNPVLSNPSGEIQITGNQVAAGTVGAHVIRTDSLAANQLTIEIQRSQSVASTTIADNGVCHFSSANFSVDANGFTNLVVPTGVLTGAAPSTISGSTLTQYQTLIAGATNSVTGSGPGTTGQVWTSNGAGMNPSFQNAGNTVNQQIVTNSMSPFSYTPTAGTNFIYVELVAGGGAGGGAGGSAGALTAGTGGGAGETIQTIIAASAQTITVGAGGVGVSAGTGGTGSSSSFGALFSVAPGVGGVNTNSSVTGFANGGLGGSTAPDAFFRIAGQNGDSGSWNAGGYVYPGSGASTPLGFGGNFLYASPTSTPIDGVAGYGYGSGGSGSLGDTVTNTSGGNGADGVCRIWEFVSA